MESHAADKERDAHRDDANRALEEVIDANIHLYIASRETLTPKYWCFRLRCLCLSRVVHGRMRERPLKGGQKNLDP